MNLYQKTTALAEQLGLTAPSRLAESPQDEHHLQALWFTHQLPAKLLTLDGQEIEITQTGFWNHKPGPDFRHAEIRLPDGKTLQGDIEIHLDASDWARHGHEKNPDYANVILHVALHGRQPALHQSVGSLRSAELAPQLDQDGLAQLSDPRFVPPNAPFPSAQPGLCSAHFAKMSAEEVRRILHEAGMLRLHKKALALSRQIQRDGARQTLWEALAVTLGYSENKIPFRLLARAITLSDIPAGDPATADALLFGASGFLPREEINTFPDESQRYITRLWHIWWAHPLSTSVTPLALEDWKLAASRPANHPHRRIAALSLLAEKLRTIHNLLKKFQLDSISEILSTLSHPHFDRAYTLRSQPADTLPHLLGANRIAQIMWNVLLPWLLACDPAADLPPFRKIPAEPENRRTLTARQRLLPDRSPPLRLDGLSRQGLITILEDFCSHASSDCRGCPFPASLEQRREK